jgi:hypothetical protein
VTADRYKTLLEPVVLALDAVTAAAQGRGYQARAAGEFLEFKLYATLHLGEQIREQLKTATSEAHTGVSGSIEVSLDREARFALYVLVDSFLFESASIRDALLQFVNAAFNLGIAEDDRGLAGKVRERLGITRTSSRGLEDWIEQSRCPAWLTRLLELRHITTHRHPLRLPEQYEWHDGGTTRPSWQGRVGIECADDTYEPLESFIEVTEQKLAGLLHASLERLLALLAK